jgi:hypothetical protein
VIVGFSRNDSIVDMISGSSPSSRIVSITSDTERIFCSVKWISLAHTEYNGLLDGYIDMTRANSTIFFDDFHWSLSEDNTEAMFFQIFAFNVFITYFTTEIKFVLFGYFENEIRVEGAEAPSNPYIPIGT